MVTAENLNFPIGGGPPPPPTGPTAGCNLSASFGSFKPGEAAKAGGFQYVNNTSGPVTITSIEISNPNPALWKVEPVATPFILKPGESKVFNVTFTPPKS